MRIETTVHHRKIKTSVDFITIHFKIHVRGTIVVSIVVMNKIKYYYVVYPGVQMVVSTKNTTQTH